jgi:hypothetical protein
MESAKVRRLGRMSRITQGPMFFRAATLLLLVLSLVVVRPTKAVASRLTADQLRTALVPSRTRLRRTASGMTLELRHRNSQTTLSTATLRRISEGEATHQLTVLNEPPVSLSPNKPHDFRLGWLDAQAWVSDSQNSGGIDIRLHPLAHSPTPLRHPALTGFWTRTGEATGFVRHCCVIDTTREQTLLNVPGLSPQTRSTLNSQMQEFRYGKERRESGDPVWPIRGVRIWLGGYCDLKLLNADFDVPVGETHVIEYDDLDFEVLYTPEYEVTSTVISAPSRSSTDR